MFSVIRLGITTESIKLHLADREPKELVNVIMILLHKQTFQKGVWEHLPGLLA